MSVLPSPGTCRLFSHLESSRLGGCAVCVARLESMLSKPCAQYQRHTCPWKSQFLPQACHGQNGCSGVGSGVSATLKGVHCCGTQRRWTYGWVGEGRKAEGGTTSARGGEGCGVAGRLGWARARPLLARLPCDGSCRHLIKRGVVLALSPAFQALPLLCLPSTHQLLGTSPGRWQRDLRENRRFLALLAQ